MRQPTSYIPPSAAAAECGTGACRLAGGIVAAASAAVLTVAAALSPNPAGHGTHRQLGLPACSTLVNTGWPCPTCGMTTAVAAMAHGQVLLAARAHPGGVVLFVVLGALAVMGLAQALTGRPVLRRLRSARLWLVAAAVILLGGWAGRIAIGLADGTLPPGR